MAKWQTFSGGRTSKRSKVANGWLVATQAADPSFKLMGLYTFLRGQRTYPKTAHRRARDVYEFESDVVPSGELLL